VRFIVPNDTTQHEPVITKTEARQGAIGNNVRYVLGASMAGIILVFGVLLFYFAHYHKLIEESVTAAWDHLVGCRRSHRGDFQYRLRRPLVRRHCTPTFGQIGPLEVGMIPDGQGMEAKWGSLG
jgi:hypothetical protein